MKLTRQDGTEVEVPDTDVGAAFASGQFGLPAGSSVPVRAPSGSVGTVPAEALQGALAKGASVVSQRDLHDAELQAKYGTTLGEIEAGAAGAARGATVGLSDVLATSLAGVFGGDAAEERVRRTLSNLKEANPISSTVGEVAGAVAPAFIGDEAGIAGTAGKLFGAPSRLVGEAGALAGRGAEAALGEAGGRSFLAITARKAAAEAANAGTQAALFEAGNAISEHALGDSELNGEKLLAAVGHGFLMGAVGGGLLSATGAVGRRVLGRASPAIAEIAENQAWRTVSGRSAFQKAADKIPGGARGVGRTLLDDGIVAAGDRVEDIAPKIAAAREAAGKEVGALLDKADAAGVAAPTAAEIGARVEDDVLGELRKMPRGNRAAIRATEDVLSDLAESKPLRAVVPDAVRQRLGARADELIAAASEAPGEARDLLRSMGATWEREPMTFRDLQSFRAKLDKRIKQTAPAYGAPVNEKNEAMKAVRWSIENALTDAGEKAEHLGPEWREAYDAAKLKYRRLIVADRAAEDAVSRMNANRAFSLTDSLAGLAGMTHGLASGVVSGGVHGLAMGVAHHVIRERGNATAAVFLDKIGALGGLQRAVENVDRQIDRGVAAIAHPGSRAPYRTRPHAFGDHEARRDAAVEATTRADDHAEGLESAIAPIAGHAPMTANAFQQAALRATAAVGAALPRHPTTAHDPLQPQFAEPQGAVSAAQREAFDRVSHLAHDPVGFTFHHIDNGTLTGQDVDHLKAIAPKLYGDMAGKLKGALLGAKKPLEFQKRLAVERFLGLSDPGRSVGALLAKAPAGGGAGPAKPGGGTGATKRVLKGPSGMAGLTGSKTPPQ